MFTSLAKQHKSKGDALDKVFEIAIIVKSLDGLLEVIGGSLLLAVSRDRLNHLVISLTQGELSRDPHDFVATHLLHSVTQLSSGTKLFGALYLLSHGLVKIVLVAALLKQKLWAYPWMMVFLAVFIIYQLYSISRELSFSLSLLTVFDLLVLWLTYIEYQRHKQSQEADSEPSAS